ncbi:MAG: LOW QUALITY PROTEIN: uncharacterized protein KVP18_004646 [Porospora cf. gigantea A]|uniref:uncharacterized protein n=1 Tax=Porospora cf. gigantea A TaxID=2853593 RepID=UPI00355A4D84|nr:MAG: LOW QUALITY PROTEIN: hypothetical protein KVP18_004646 [Porospora cf. gigantea A]
MAAIGSLGIRESLQLKAAVILKTMDSICSHAAAEVNLSKELRIQTDHTLLARLRGTKADTFPPTDASRTADL